MLRFSLLLVVVAIASPAFGQSTPDPLDPTVAQAFAGLPADPEPEEITRGTHYWVSNEDGHWVTREHIADSGGVYLGVGAEQNYLLAGWSRPEVMVLLDFDQQIVNLHFGYGALFTAAETPEEFLALWDEDRLDEVHSLIWQILEGEEADAVHETMGQTIDRCGRRLRRLQEHYEALGVPSFLTDRTVYEFVRGMWTSGRVFPVRGDLTADGTMLAVAEVARTNGLPMRTMYFSNAEQYFEYEAQFTANIVAQPYDDRSIIIHTRQYSGWDFAEDDDYHYALQPGANFVAWLLSGDATDFLQMARRARRELRAGLSILDIEPGD